MASPPNQLYFAYGSNLCLQQMAARCPESRYVGRAILSGYKWQINQRGVANIIPRRRSSVHGLVFELGPGDEARLDRAEGVRRGLYTKKYEHLLLYPAREKLQIRVQRIVERGGPASSAFQRRQYDDTGRGGQSVYVASNVLVYISDQFKEPGDPRDEYVGRINDGVFDAVTLGVPRNFFQTEVRPFVPASADELRPAARIRPGIPFPPPRLTKRHALEPLIRYAGEPVVSYTREPVTQYARQPVIRYAREPVIQYANEPVRQSWSRWESPELSRQRPIVVDVQPRREKFVEDQPCWLCLMGSARTAADNEPKGHKRTSRVRWYVL